MTGHRTPTTAAEIADLCADQLRGLRAHFSTDTGTDPATGRRRLALVPEHPCEHLPHARPGLIARTSHTWLDLAIDHGLTAAADVEIAHLVIAVSGYTIARLWRLTGGLPTREIRPGSGDWQEIRPSELPAVWLAVAARVAALPWVDLGEPLAPTPPPATDGAHTDDPRRRYSRRMQFTAGPHRVTFYACPAHWADLESGRGVPCFVPIPGEGVRDRGVNTGERCDLCREE